MSARFRIYAGVLFVLCGAPLYVACLTAHWSVPLLLWSAFLIGSGVAALYPARWTK